MTHAHFKKIAIWKILFSISMILLLGPGNFSTAFAQAPDETHSRQPVAKSEIQIQQGNLVHVEMTEDGSTKPFVLMLNVAHPYEGDIYQWAVRSQAAHGEGSVETEGSQVQVSYEGEPGFIGQDAFLLEVRDSRLATAFVLVQVSVAPADPTLATKVHTTSATNGITMVPQVNTPVMEVSDYYASGKDWPDGAPVTLSIDFPANGTGVDAILNKVPSLGVVSYSLRAYKMVPGTILKMSNGTIEKVLTIPELTVSEIDYPNNTMSGYADPNLEFQIIVEPDDDYGGIYPFTVIANPEGNWSFDLTAANPALRIASSFVSLAKTDSDGDLFKFARDGWLTPQFTVALDMNMVYAVNAWFPGSTLTMTVDDPANGAGVDYTETKSMAGTQSFFSVGFMPDPFQISGGQTVVLTDGIYTKSIEVAPLSITQVDYGNSIVRGTGTPGKQIDIAICMQTCRQENTSVNSSGLWYTHVNSLYLQEGGLVYISLEQEDDDYDRTTYNQLFQYPIVAADLTTNMVYGFQWPEGSTVTVNIDDPSNGTNIDYSANVPVSGSGLDTYFELDPGTFQLKPTQVISATNGSISRNLVLPPLALTGIDLEHDKMAGSAGNGFLSIYIYGPWFRSNPYNVTIDPPHSSWTVDFETGANTENVDISLGMKGYLEEIDGKGNIIWSDWAILPIIGTVSPSFVQVGSPELTLTIAGEFFSENTVVYWNGNPLETTYVSQHQLTAQVPATSFDSIGTAVVTAVEPEEAPQNSAQVAITTFADVVPPAWYYNYVEGLYAQGVTGGCATSPLRYCPDRQVTRAQMAVFLLKAEHGSDYVPLAASGTLFGDVPADHWAGGWIEALADESITSGCGAGMYCPNNPVTRAQMAIFLLKAEHGSDYVPPAPSGVFGDVPADHWAAGWIEQLAAEGITTGCSAGMYCPQRPVTRAQMAVFIDKTFGFPQMP